MSLARPVLRSPALRFASRRFQSTASSTTEKAAATAKNTVEKAQQGLSRVSSAAGPAIAGAAKGLGNTVGKVGGRTGKIIAFIQQQTPFVVYYSKVGFELSRMVFQAQKMSPPSVATFQTYYQNLWKSIQNRTILQSPAKAMQALRGMGTAQLVAGGVVFAECLGFFTIGEMIGRFKLVGYHGEGGAAHH